MTSTSVRDGYSVMNSPIMNVIRQRSVPVPGNTGDIGGGFGRAMGKASGSKPEGHSAAAAAETPRRIDPQSRPAERVKPKETAVAEENPTDDTVHNQDRQIDVPADEQIMGNIREAGKEAIAAIAEEMGISEEEVIAAMEALGLLPVELLEPQNLTALILEISGEDVSALVTDEQLYATVNNLTGQISGITEQLLKETGLTPEALKEALEQAAQQATEVSAEVTAKALAEEIVKASEDLAETTRTPENESTPQAGEGDSQEITIVIEKNGEVTEITAKADEKGNLQATKEVTTTPTESAAQNTGEQSTGNHQKNSENSAEQELAGRNSLLETLLQNRSRATEIVAEPVPMAEVPDTEQIMRQILDIMKIQLKPEMTQLEMQLHPESLGTIHVQIAAKEGVITAQLTAQNDVVKAALESQIVELKENMRNQGIKVEAVEVNVQSQSFESSLRQGKDGNDRGYPSDKKNTRRINLNALDTDELPEDLTEAEQLATEMMMENGGTVDFTA